MTALGIVPRTHVLRLSRTVACELICLGTLVAVPLTAQDSFLADRLGGFMILGIFALSVDLLWGYGGLLSFGHAAFYGTGGYALAILTTGDKAHLALPLVLGLAGAILAPMVMAWLLAHFSFSGGKPLLGVYFAVVTFALAVVLQQFAEAGGTLTGGRNGILLGVTLSLPVVGQLSGGFGFYWFALVALVATYCGVRLYTRSARGLRLRGLRDNEDRLELLGHDSTAAKREALVLSAGLAGLAGAISALHDGIVTPGSVGLGPSIQVLVWVLLGGRGTLLGPVVAAIGLSYLTATMSGVLLDTWLLVVGGVLVAVTLLLRGGLLGFLAGGYR